MTDHFKDPRVAYSVLTCGACPEQYDGMLTDGRPLYFRYRSGWASLAIGADCLGGEDVGMEHGDSLQGMFESPEDRNRVFTALLDDALGGVS